jgi:hypothetical protein
MILSQSLGRIRSLELENNVSMSPSDRVGSAAVLVAFGAAASGDLCFDPAGAESPGCRCEGLDTSVVTVTERWPSQ